MANCTHCGKLLPKRKRGPGRPAEMHKRCQRTGEAFRAFLRCSDRIEYSKRAASALRAELWLIGNQLRVTGDDPQLGRDIRRWRLESDLTQASVATRIGCTRRRLGRLERGQARWSHQERRAATLLLINAG